MKKYIIAAALAVAALGAQAATTVEGSKFTDNWSVTLKGGGVMSTGIASHRSYRPLLESRGIIGLELRKQLTPVFGLGAEGEWTFNTSSWTGIVSPNVFDHQYVGVFGTVNLMNAIGGYKGEPRLFEIEAVAGTGWLHAYYPKSIMDDGNSWATKVGLNFNFNLGDKKAWTLALKPAMLFNMNGSPEANVLGYSAEYNVNHGYFELEAGVTYHFGNSNGTHHFVIVRPYDQAEIDALNAQINDLRAQIDANTANSAALVNKLNDLKAQLDACNRRPAAVEKVVNDLNNIYYVFFNFSSATVQANQQPNIAMVADQLKANSNAKVTVKGYASKDGSLSFNEKLAQRRADAVKKELVKRYGIDANRVNAEGQGIGSLFQENSWNRCAVCTIAE